MARPKDSTALYEVIGNRSEEQPAKLTVPGWWQSRDTSLRKESPAAQAVKPEPKPAPTLRPISTTDEDVAGRPPVVRIRGGRVELSLSPVSAIVTLGVTFLVVFTSYQLGAGLQSDATPTPMAVADSVQADRTKEQLTRAGVSDPVPPRLSSVLPPARQQPQNNVPVAPRPTVASATPADRVAGLNYVILESFQEADRDDAVHAQDWFNSKGVRTTLEKSGSKYVLVSSEGFDYAKPGDKDRCSRLMENIQALGRGYKREFAGRRVIRYGFQSPMPKRY